MFSGQKKIMLSAGEVSGDLLGAGLVRRLKKTINARFYGLGGPEMKKAGVQILQDITSHSSVGLMEGIKPLLPSIAILLTLKRQLRENPPDVIILIDNQGFNIHLSRMARRLGVKNIYYFPPPVWIWGKHNAKRLAKTCDHLISCFPPEQKIYQDAGAVCTYVGHPFGVDIVPRPLPRPKSKFTVALLPGSRYQEVSRLTRPLLEAADRLQKTFTVLFILPFANDECRNTIVRTIETGGYGHLNIRFIQSPQHSFMKQCDLILAASGTASLAAAFYGIPCVVIYQISTLSYLIAKNLLLKVNYISMPNILLNKRVIPELLQNKATGANLYDAAKRFLSDRSYYEQTRQDLLKVRRILTKKNIFSTITRIVQRYL